MKGFFSKQETRSTSRPEGKTLSCVTCGLTKNAKTPRMPAFGNFEKKILNIGEAPGEVEDSRGRPWQGKTGQLLERTYEKLGIDLFEDCLNINACNCRPIGEDGNNRTPTNTEIDCCRKSIMRLIQERKPKVIALLGGAALYSIIGHRWKKDLGGISKWRGWTIPDRDLNVWVCPTFHPSYIERSEGEITAIWEQDLRQIIQKANEPLPEYITPRINVIDDLSVLNDIPPGVISVDYETTGIKPHAPGHRIVAASVATGPNDCYAFMMPETYCGRLPLIQLLNNPSYAKMAHHMKFEHTWSLVRLKTEVNNWHWDSMLAAHVLDNRSGITGLKFQAYVNFGIVDYSSEITPYLESGEDSANAMNRIQDLIKSSDGREKLLEYCGYDSIYEYRLAMTQRGIMNLT